MRCLWCHKDVVAGWALCPDCGSTLEAGPAGERMVPQYRPASEKPFDPFVIASVRRMTPTGPLVVLGKNERVEANLIPAADAVVCRDLNGPVLFRLQKYRPVGGGVVAFTDDGAPIATYLPTAEGTLEVRDSATAPVATLVAGRDGGTSCDLMERGGKQRLATCWASAYQIGEWVDEHWFVMPTADGRLPLTTLALVALPVVCHAWLGTGPRRVKQTQGAGLYEDERVLGSFFGGW